MSFREWRRRRELAKRARRLVTEALRDAEKLSGTSLHPRHASRFMVTDYQTKEETGELSWIEFSILRHPRPYAFSRQAHQVIELYRFDLLSGKIKVLKGFNVTRAEGRDAD